VAATDTLLKPEECVMLLVDFQAGLGFGVESSSRQFLLNNALARTAAAFIVAGRSDNAANTLWTHGAVRAAQVSTLTSTSGVARPPRANTANVKTKRRST
jgi:hypothetical protein